MALSPTSSRGVSSSAVTLIEDQTLSVAASGITFLAISGTLYSHLLIVASLRTVKVATADAVGLRFNADTGANYYSELTAGVGAGTASTSEGLTTTYMQLGTAPGANAPGNNFAAYHVTIPSYVVAHNKVVVADALDAFGTTSGTIQVSEGGGLWANTAAVTSITLLSGTAATNLEAGSRATLYGLA